MPAAASKKIIKDTSREPSVGKIRANTVMNKQSGFKSTKYKQIAEMTPIEAMELCGKFFVIDPVVQNSILSMSSMGFKKITYRTSGDKSNKIKDLLDDITRDLGYMTSLRWAYLTAKVYGTVPVVESWTAKQYKVGTQTKTIRVPKLSIIHPPDCRLVSTPFTDEDILTLKVGKELRSLYKEEDIPSVNKRYLKPVFEGVLPAGSVDRDRNYIDWTDILFKFSTESSSVFKGFGFPWDRYGLSPITGAFNALQRKMKYIEADMATADGIINAILVAKVGTDQVPGLPEEVEALDAILANAARTFTLTWDHRLSLEFLSPDPSVLENTKKYELINDEIREGLGFSFLNTGAKGRRDVDKIMKMLVEVIDGERRELLIWFKTRIIDRIVEENPTVFKSAEVTPQLNKISLGVDEALKSAVGLYYDRGLYSRHTTLELSDEDYDEQKELKQSEKADEEIFSPPTKNTDFFKSPGTDTNPDRERKTDDELENEKPLEEDKTGDNVDAMINSFDKAVLDKLRQKLNDSVEE